MFVAGRVASAPASCDGVFTHYKREEDATMESGKLDEELARMSDIVDHITPGCILLCNESFASTNEREGSQIARQIVTARCWHRASGCSSSPTCSTWPIASTPSEWRTRCSCAPNDTRTGSEHSG